MFDEILKDNKINDAENKANKPQKRRKSKRKG
jgi:hypothetical protein